MRPRVSVIVIAYNQRQTVAQTLECIVAQERDFPIEVVVGDDGSTDGTREVCEEFAARYPYIRLMGKAPNKGILGNYLDCLAGCRGDYVASCAGDDFWHDERKLRLQVDFLDANPDYGVVHTNMCDLDMRTGVTTPRKPFDAPQGWLGRQVFWHHIVNAPTACFRRSLAEYIDFEEWKARGFVMEDLPMWIEFAQHTRFKYLPEHTVTYRIWDISASRGGGIEKRLRFIEGSRDIMLYFWDKYHPAFPRRKIINKYRRNTIRTIVEAGEAALFRKRAREFGIAYSLVMALHARIRMLGKRSGGAKG